MLPAHPLAGPVATGGYGGASAAAGVSRKFACRARALPQWADEGVLGVEDLGDTPRFPLTDALHWDSYRVIETWS